MWIKNQSKWIVLVVVGLVVIAMAFMTKNGGAGALFAANDGTTVGSVNGQFRHESIGRTA